MKEYNKGFEEARSSLDVDGKEIYCYCCISQNVSNINRLADKACYSSTAGLIPESQRASTVEDNEEVKMKLDSDPTVKTDQDGNKNELLMPCLWV